MPKTKLQPPFDTFSGTIGKLVYRQVGDKTIVSVKPDNDRPLSEKEAGQRQNFTQASAWATAAMKDMELALIYKALGKQRKINPRAAAMSDALKPPFIEGLDLTEYSGQDGEPIYFLATDNGGVASAKVAITNGNGTTYEEGWAVEIDGDSGYRMYTTKSRIPAGSQVLVTVQVSDRPGNVTELSAGKIF